MKNKEFWKGPGVVLLLVVLVIGNVSLVMNVLRMQMEKEIAGALSAGSRTTVPTKVEVLNVLAGGTVYLDEDTQVEELSECFGLLGRIVPNYEIAVYNQEDPVSTEQRKALADALSGNGFNLVSLAGPSALKNGKEGILSSIEFWKNREGITSGIYGSTDESHEIPILTYGTISTTLLSFTEYLDADLPEQQRYLVNLYDDEKSVQAVQKAAEVADVVIVDLFWKSGGTGLPDERQKEIAGKLANAGASVIIGHMEGTIQPIAWIDDTLVYYSVGSLIDGTNEQLGILGGVTISKTAYGDHSRIELTNPRAELVKMVNGDTGYRILMIKDMEGLPETEEAKNIIQSLDDSIRIGGVE